MTHVRRNIKPNAHDLGQDKINEEYRNRKYVIVSIRKLGKATTTEIFIQMKKDVKDHNEKLKKDIESSYGSYDDMLSPKQKENRFNKNKRKDIGLRTIQRAVKGLNQLHIIHKSGKRYSLGSNALNEMRYFSEEFATPGVSSITWFPLKTLEQSLEELILRYGAFIIFVFIEGARPIISNHPNDNIDKKKLFDSWLQNALPVREMFDLFFELYRAKENNSDTELAEKTIQKLTRIFERKHPAIFKQLSDAKLTSIGFFSSIEERKISELEQIKAIKSSTRLRKPGEPRREYAGSSYIKIRFVHPKPKDWYSQLVSE